MNTLNATLNLLPPVTVSRGDNELPTGTFRGDNELPSGTFRGDNELPTGTFRGDNELPTGTFRGDNELPSGTFRANINSGYNDRVNKREPATDPKKKGSATDKVRNDTQDKVHKILSK